MDHRYAAHHAFIRPARGATALWRIVVVIAVIEVIFAISGDVFAAFLPSEALRDAFYAGVSTFGTLAQLVAFGIAGAGFVILLRLLHGRGFASLIGPADQARRDMIRTLLAVGAVLLVLELLPPWIDMGEIEQMRDLGTWLFLIPLTLLALLVQVGTEEMVFRGYLQQQFACISGSRWAWMVVPSVMFGTLHFWNGHGVAEGIIWAVWATGLGIACADLTARTGNLGPAIGLHLANNAFALLVVGIAGWPSSGVALFLYPYQDPELYSAGAAALLQPWLVYEFGVIMTVTWIMWLAARISLRC